MRIESENKKFKRGADRMRPYGIGFLILAVLDAVALWHLYAVLFGEPPYEHFVRMRLIIPVALIGTAALSAVWPSTFTRISAFGIVGLAALQGFAKFSKDEWRIFNWVSLAVVALGLIAFLTLYATSVFVVSFARKRSRVASLDAIAVQLLFRDRVDFSVVYAQLAEQHSWASTSQICRALELACAEYMYRPSLKDEIEAFYRSAPNQSDPSREDWVKQCLLRARKVKLESEAVGIMRETVEENTLDWFVIQAERAKGGRLTESERREFKGIADDLAACEARIKELESQSTAEP